MKTFIDSHVHVHPGCDVGVLVDSASCNFDTQAEAQGAESWTGVLLLSETKAANWFEDVHGSAGITVGGWYIQPHVSDPLVLTASVSNRRILFVAGRQIVTAEGVEVLALFTRERIPDGMALHETLGSAAHARALTVLPWAVGKWIGRRGMLVSQAVRGDRHRLHAGDNGGRPWFWPRPGLFRDEAARNSPVFNGSDTLPIAGDERRVGSYGFSVQLALSDPEPAQQLRAFLSAATAADVGSFGRLQGAIRFFSNQVGLRLAARRVSSRG